jgi:hypothetical protein
MTDIDALVAEARKLFLIGIAPSGEETMAGRLLDALTTERAKVAALEADVKFWQERHDNIQDRRKIDDAALQNLFCRAHVAAGHPADDEDQSNDAHIGRLFIQHRYAFAKAVADQAEAARWREVAMELAGALGEAFKHGEIMNSERRMNRCGAALTRYKQEIGQ